MIAIFFVLAMSDIHERNLRFFFYYGLIYFVTHCCVLVLLVKSNSDHIDLGRLIGTSSKARSVSFQFREPLSWDSGGNDK